MAIKNKRKQGIIRTRRAGSREFTAPLHGWCFVVIRERIREDKAAVGRSLLDVPGYHRAADRRSDVAADGFYMQDFFATEAAFLAALLFSIS